jgi:hypothetical protein
VSKEAQFPVDEKNPYTNGCEACGIMPAPEGEPLAQCQHGNAFFHSAVWYHNQRISALEIVVHDLAHEHPGHFEPGMRKFIRDRWCSDNSVRCTKNPLT